MKKIIAIIIIITIILIVGCSSNVNEVKTRKGLQQEVTGSVVAVDYDEINLQNKSLGDTG